MQIRIHGIALLAGQTREVSPELHTKLIETRTDHEQLCQGYCNGSYGFQVKFSYILLNCKRIKHEFHNSHAFGFLVSIPFFQTEACSRSTFPFSLEITKNFKKISRSAYMIPTL